MTSHFFPEILHTLLNPAIWLVKSIWPMTWEPNLSRHWICGKISMAIWLFISYYFLEKVIVYFWQILPIFGQTRHFLKNLLLPDFPNFGYVLLCKISEKNWLQMDRQIEGQIDWQSWIYRTLPPRAWGQKRKIEWNKVGWHSLTGFYGLFFTVIKCHIYVRIVIIMNMLLNMKESLQKKTCPTARLLLWLEWLNLRIFNVHNKGFTLVRGGGSGGSPQHPRTWLPPPTTPCFSDWLTLI